VRGVERGRSSPLALAALGVAVAGYLVLAAVGGAPRSPLVPPLPRGTGPPGWAVAASGALGLAGLGHTGLSVLSLAVLGTVLASFAVLLREAWRGQLGTAAALCGTLLSVAVATAAPLLLSRDVYSYAAYGRMVALYGADPYRTAPSAFPEDPFVEVASRQWVYTPSLYGPLFTLVSAGLAAQDTGSPGEAILRFKALAGLSLIVAAVASGGAAAVASGGAAAARPGLAPFAVAVVGLNPVLVVHTVGGGHNDALVGAFLASALLVAVRANRSQGRPAGGGLGTVATVLLTLAALVKAVAALALLGWLWWLALGRPDRRPGPDVPAGRSIRSSLAAVFPHVVVAGALAAAVASLLGGWRAAAAMATLASVEGWASGPRLVARGARALGGAVGGSALGDALAAAVYATFVLGAATVAWLGLRRTRALAAGPRPLDERPVAAAPAGGARVAAPLGEPPVAAAPAGGARVAAPLEPPVADALGIPPLVFVLGAPYLLPWYVSWFAPSLPLLSDPFLRAAGLVTAAVLALTGVPAEPGPDPALWEAMVLVVHYVAAPVVLALLVLVALRLARAGPRARPGRRPQPATATAVPRRGPP
jgi:hypothetical protein